MRFENSISPCLLYVFVATERAFYCQKLSSVGLNYKQSG